LLSWYLGDMGLRRRGGGRFLGRQLWAFLGFLLVSRGGWVSFVLTRGSGGEDEYPDILCCPYRPWELGIRRQGREFIGPDRDNR
jgi:hypothetical protein